MFLRNVFTESRSRRASAMEGSNGAAVARAAVGAACEMLEQRRLLTTYTYTVPTATPAHTAAYLQATLTAGEVQVRLDDPNTGSIGATFTNPGSNPLDVVQVQSGVSGFMFVDQLAGSQHPSGGVQVLGGHDNKFRIEAGADDVDI
jgi:hypothetical protein